MNKKQVGKFYEKRGDDHFTVNATVDGEVVEIIQYDSKAAFGKHLNINFWAADAPKLIALIQKAAGIKTPKVEYEYNIEYTNLITGRVWLYRSLWEPKTDWLERKLAESEAIDRKLLNIIGKDRMDYTQRLVKRAKAGEVEAA